MNTIIQIGLFCFGLYCLFYVALFALFAVGWLAYQCWKVWDACLVAVLKALEWLNREHLWKTKP